MPDDILSPAPELEEAPAIQPTDDNQPEAELETPATDEGTEEKEPVEELDTIDFGGKQYQVPKALKPGFMMQSDYTQKTQATAERNRELDAREQRIAQQAQVADEELQARAALYSIDQQLQQYVNTDWNKWEQEAPLDANSGFRAFQMLKDNRAQLASFLHQRQEERSHETQRVSAKRLEDTYAFASQKIPGWTPDVGQKVADFAASHGVTQEMMKASINPGLYHILYKAWVGDQALKKQASPKPTQQQPPPQPTATVQGKKPPASNKPLGEMTMEEYVAARKAGRTR